MSEVLDFSMAPRHMQGSEAGVEVLVPAARAERRAYTIGGIAVPNFALLGRLPRDDDALYSGSIERYSTGEVLLWPGRKLRTDDEVVGFASVQTWVVQSIAALRIHVPKNGIDYYLNPTYFGTEPLDGSMLEGGVWHYDGMPSLTYFIDDPTEVLDEAFQDAYGPEDSNENALFDEVRIGELVQDDIKNHIKRPGVGQTLAMAEYCVHAAPASYSGHVRQGLVFFLGFAGEVVLPPQPAAV